MSRNSDGTDLFLAAAIPPGSLPFPERLPPLPAKWSAPVADAPAEGIWRGFEQVKIRCTMSACADGLHCYRLTKKLARLLGPGTCRECRRPTNAACALGARIVLCQPTVATRPGVAEERAALLDELPRLGYACRRVDAAYVRYRMPHFEAASLKVTAPDLLVPEDWRVGDRMTLEKIGEALPQLVPAATAEEPGASRRPVLHFACVLLGVTRLDTSDRSGP
jgi:hypothetical protein